MSKIRITSSILVCIIYFVCFGWIYSQTPSDPQKAVGYVIIAIYSIITGLGGYALFEGVFQIWSRGPSLPRIFAAVFGIAVVLGFFLMGWSNSRP